MARWRTHVYGCSADNADTSAPTRGLTVMRPTFLLPIFIYTALCTIPLIAGLSLVISPQRTGTFLHDAFIIFPSVDPQEVAKRWFYRLLGIASLVAWVGAVYSIYSHIISPLIHVVN